MLETLPTLGGGVHVDDALAAAELEAVLVDVGALAVAVLRDREDEAKPNSQNGNPSKINPEKWHVFRARKLTVNFPAFTSNPPQLHHQKTTSNHPFFAKTPGKNKVPPPTKKLLRKHPSSSRVWLLRGDYDDSQFALVFKVEDLGAPNPRKLSDYGEWSRDVRKTQDHEFLQRTQLRLIAPFYGDFHGFEGSTSG